VAGDLRPDRTDRRFRALPTTALAPIQRLHIYSLVPTCTPKEHQCFWICASLPGPCRPEVCRRGEAFPVTYLLIVSLIHPQVCPRFLRDVSARSPVPVTTGWEANPSLGIPRERALRARCQFRFLGCIMIKGIQIMQYSVSNKE
jgi:hypothetical protein